MRIVGSVMSASLGWDPKRRRREEEEALEQLRKQKEGMVDLRAGLGRRGRPVTEREPALEETLKERWRAEVGADSNEMKLFLKVQAGDRGTGLSHWQLLKLVREVQPLLTEEQLMRWVLSTKCHFVKGDKYACFCSGGSDRLTLKSLGLTG